MLRNTLSSNRTLRKRLEFRISVYLYPNQDIYYLYHFVICNGSSQKFLYCTRENYATLGMGSEIPQINASIKKAL